MFYKKIIAIFAAIFMLAGCQNTTTQEPIESTEPFTVQIFFSQTCPHCKKLKKDYVDALKEDFGEQVSFVEHDIDLQESIDLYDSYLGLYDSENDVWDLEGKLEGVKGEFADYQRYIPFVVVGDMYAFMGYTEEWLDAYVQDVHLALQNKELSTGDTAVGRWLFKQEDK